MRIRLQIAVLLWFATGTAAALEPAAPMVPRAASGTVQYAFTPEHHADQMIIAAIDAARQQVLVQAYSFTHRRIADALVRAKSRGVEVVVLADQEQARANPAVLGGIARSGVPVLMDAHHAAAHNKIIVIDAGRAECAVITGSFNFTFAAQHRNAENALIVGGDAPLCEAYFNNWRRHQAHSRALAKSR